MVSPNFEVTKCRYRKQDYQHVVWQLGEKVVFYKMVSYHASAFAPTGYYYWLRRLDAQF
jgi:hypothetical protein